MIVGPEGTDEKAGEPASPSIEASVNDTMRHWIEQTNYLLEQAIDQLFSHGIELEQITKWTGVDHKGEGWMVDKQIVYTITTEFVWRDEKGVRLPMREFGAPIDFDKAKFFVEATEHWSGAMTHLNVKSEALATSTPEP